jgi:hypothetical protein
MLSSGSIEINRRMQVQAISHSIMNLTSQIKQHNIKPLHIFLLILLLTMTSALAKFTRGSLGNTSTNKAPYEQTTPRRAWLSEGVSLRAAGIGNPWINLSDGRDLITDYSGPPELCQSLRQNSAVALSLSSADFDGDGVPDLIASYSAQGSGIISMLRGNADAIYPNSPDAKQRKTDGSFTPAPFLSPAYLFGLPEPADFVAAGDFDADGLSDIVAARRGGSKLYLLKGDGQGGLFVARDIELGGEVTSLIAGEVNRADGLDDIVVAISGASSAKVLVFEGPEGAFRSKPEAFDLCAEATSLALGQFDSQSPMDLAIATRHDLITIRGRYRTRVFNEISRSDTGPLISKQTFPFTLRSVIAGDFAGGHKIALLSDDGSVYLACQNEEHDNFDSGLDRAQWKIEMYDRIQPDATSQLVRTRMTNAQADTLLAFDQRHYQLKVLKPDAGPKERINAETTGYDKRQVLLESNNIPLALLPLRLNEDALSDLVLLGSNQRAPSILMTLAGTVFRVFNTNDDGPGSLRQAIVDANNNPGADTINFSIPGAGIPSIRLLSQLPSVEDAVTIDGTSQFGGRVELACAFQRQGYGLRISAGNTVVRGLVINRDSSTAIRLETNGNNLIEGNYIGTDVTGTSSLGAEFTGVWIDGSSNNTVGGTTEAARNVISGNNLHGIEIKEAVNNKIEGNYIGTDVSGNADLGNLGEGILVYIGARNNIIGGTIPGSRNLISGNDGRGIGMYKGANANIVQGNFIGTNAQGTGALGNSFNGINITGAPDNMVGGSTAPAINVISGNRANGVAIGVIKDEQTGAVNTLVRGNYIGTDVSGNSSLANGENGIFVDADSISNTIVENRIAFNNRNGIEIPNAATINRSGVRIGIISNAIFSNSGLAIDLGQPGVTANDFRDLDEGANRLQNFPVVTSAISIGTTITVKGIFNSTPNSSFNLQFFHTGTCERCSGNGSVCLVPLVIDTRQIRTNPNGDYDFSLEFALPQGRRGGVINCTATSSDQNTSEVSPACVVLCTCECPGDISQAATSSTGAQVTYSVRMDGSCSGARVACSPPTGSTFPITTTPVICTVTDIAGNTATCGFKVTVTPKPAPIITDVSRDKKKLYIDGDRFEKGAEILINGRSQKTTYKSDFKLVGKKAGNIIQSGDKVRVKNPDHTLSEEYVYRP